MLCLSIIFVRFMITYSLMLDRTIGWSFSSSSQPSSHPTTYTPTLSSRLSSPLL